MGIKQVVEITYQVTCDICDRNLAADFIDDGIDLVNRDHGQAIDSATNKDWEVKGEVIVCPKCLNLNA